MIAQNRDIDEYLLQSQKQLQDEIIQLQNSMNKTNEHDVKMKIALANYHHAKLLSSLGLQRESLPFFRQAWHAAVHYVPTLNMVMKDLMTDSMTLYSRVAYSVGVDYVVVLDYLAENAECDRLFEVLNNSMYNEGPHIGDYAFYLHRRKRDFDSAER